jgi:taurine transport system permease protein
MVKKRHLPHLLRLLFVFAGMNVIWYIAYLLMNHSILPSPTYPIPKIALLPVVMLFFGLGETSKVLMIMLILLFQVIISVRDGVKAIPESTYDVLTSIGASSMQKFWNVTLPGALSVILSTIRISLGTAISVLFFTEIYGTEHGMGFFIMDAWLRLDYPEMYAGIMLFSLVGFVLFLLVDLLDYRFMKWRR